MHRKILIFNYLSSSLSV